MKKSPSDFRDQIDLDQHILWQPGNFDSGSRRGNAVFTQICAIDSVHSSEVIEILKEDSSFYDALKPAAAGFEDGFQVFKHLRSLIRDSAGHNLLCRRIQRNLSRRKKSDFPIGHLASMVRSPKALHRSR